MVNSFAVLLKHFFDRFFDRESLSPQADSETSLAQVLGLLAVPGAFFVLLFRPFTITGWSLVSVRYFYVSFSMIVMAFIVVLKWDALFPDRRDYHILMPLPLRLPALFLAKAGALGLFLGLFLVDINFFGALFWTGIDTRPNVLNTYAAHVVSVVAGGLFAALAAAAVQGVLMTFLSGPALRRASVVLQTVLLGMLVMLLILIPYLGSAMYWLFHADRAFVRYFPCYWFVGLYERLRPATRDPLLLHIGGTAVKALWISAGVFLLTYLPGYRRHARNVLEAPEPDPKGPGLLRRVFESAVNRVLLPHPVQRAVFHFISETVMRSMKHRIFLAVYAGFGAAIAVMTLGSGRSGLLQFPLTMSFVLVSGLRAAFNFPSELRANWAFQISEATRVGEYLKAARKWIVFCTVLPFFLLMAPGECYSFAWKTALFHLAFGFALAVLLAEAMFLGYRKVPFTCAYFPGKMNLIGLGSAYVLGFTMYSRTMAQLETWLVDWPVAAAGFFALVLCGTALLARWRDRDLETEETLDYVDESATAIRTLGLASD